MDKIIPKRILINIESGGNMIGGESAIINEMVHFRSSVRDIAIKSHYDGKRVNAICSQILNLFDEARNTMLPRLGVEVFDGNIGNTREETGPKLSMKIHQHTGRMTLQERMEVYIDDSTMKCGNH